VRACEDNDEQRTNNSDLRGYLFNHPISLSFFAISPSRHLDVSHPLLPFPSLLYRVRPPRYRGFAPSSYPFFRSIRSQHLAAASVKYRNQMASSTHPNARSHRPSGDRASLHLHSRRSDVVMRNGRTKTHSIQTVYSARSSLLSCSICMLELIACTRSIAPAADLDLEL
jgi:hypothetical protein